MNSIEIRIGRSDNYSTNVEIDQRCIEINLNDGTFQEIRKNLESFQKKDKGTYMSILPFKIGDYIYSMNTYYKNIPYLVVSISINGNEVEFYSSYFDKSTGCEEDTFVFNILDVGKTVFPDEI